MSDAAIQMGQTLKIAFGNFALAMTDITIGHVLESVELSPEADITGIKDKRGATVTQIIQDPRTRYRVTIALMATTTTIEPPAKGEVMTVTPVSGAAAAYFVDASSSAVNSGVTRWTLDLIKEASMTYVDA
jgi:hypothetical protein